jgi:UDP-N-acetylglucosamine--N-acetylmuramyl-(pentapeptide) pyrophosphoryl-undecaprenol N-acetylglucosamine transferase
MVRPVVITGGGTGGHVFPMQAIAESLRHRGLDASEVRYVGSRRGQERTLLAGDVVLTLLPGRGLRRSWRISDLFANVGSLIGLAAALVLAQSLVARRRPSVVVSVGGYASFAVSFAAVCWRVPLVLVDFDAVPGAAHRLLSPFAAARCTAFASVGDNVFVTGAPLRADIESIDRSSHARRAARALQTPPIDPGRAVVLVMTGSLGSHRVNEAVRDLARAWATRSDRALIHVTGARDYDEFAATKPLVESLDYRVIEFGDMVELWGLCDVAICRAGAITVAELEVLGVPAVLVPLPGAPHDHQSKNARALADAGGAIVLSDAQCTGDALAEALDIMTSLDTMEEMGRAVHTLAHPHAAEAIADVVLGIRSRE